MIFFAVPVVFLRRRGRGTENTKRAEERNRGQESCCIHRDSRCTYVDISISVKASSVGFVGKKQFKSASWETETLGIHSGEETNKHYFALCLSTTVASSSPDTVRRPRGEKGGEESRVGCLRCGVLGQAVQLVDKLASRQSSSVTANGPSASPVEQKGADTLENPPATNKLHVVLSSLPQARACPFLQSREEHGRPGVPLPTFPFGFSYDAIKLHLASFLCVRWLPRHTWRASRHSCRRERTARRYTASGYRRRGCRDQVGSLNALDVQRTEKRKVWVFEEAMESVDEKQERGSSSVEVLDSRKRFHILLPQCVLPVSISRIRVGGSDLFLADRPEEVVQCTDSRPG